MPEPQLIEIEPSLYAYVHRTCPVAEIGTTMREGIGLITSALSAQGVTSTGPWFTHHFRRPLAVFDYEICFPIARPIKPVGDVRNGNWPRMQVARLIHEGNYDTIVPSWMALEAWMKQRSLTLSGEFWERYLIGGAQDPNPENWRTELNWPIGR